MFRRNKKTNKSLFSSLYEKDETFEDAMKRFDNFDDEDGNITIPPKRVVDNNKIGLGLSLLGLVATGVGIGAVVKNKKKKRKTKEELIIKMLNDKTLKELQELTLNPKGKTKEQLINEIKIKLK